MAPTMPSILLLPQYACCPRSVPTIYGRDGETSVSGGNPTLNADYNASPVYRTVCGIPHHYLGNRLRQRQLCPHSRGRGAFQTIIPCLTLMKARPCWLVALLYQCHGWQRADRPQLWTFVAYGAQWQCYLGEFPDGHSRITQLSEHALERAQLPQETRFRLAQGGKGKTHTPQVCRSPRW